MLYFSLIQINPVYDEENFTKIDFPKILVNPNIRHHLDILKNEEDKTIEKMKDHDINSRGQISPNFQSVNSKEEDFIKLKKNSNFLKNT